MRVAVTGAAGDFGTAILRRLLGDERVEQVVAVDVRPPRLEHPRLRAEVCDVRSPRLAELCAGCEAVIHLAFVLIPGRDVAESRSVNLDGTRNVVEACAVAGVRRLVVASSLSAHGVPTKDQPPVTERTPPQPSPGHFYFHDKAEAERLLSAWEAEHPDSELVITRLRPGFVYGRDFSNPALEMIGARLAVLPDDGGRTQLVGQDEIAAAFCAAAFRDAPGGFLLVTEDSISIEELAAFAGGRVVRVPKGAARAALDAAHALRLSPLSGEWAVSGDRVGEPGRAREELGWRPALSSRESALAVLAQHGRRLRYLDGPPRAELAERMLEVATAILREARERNEALAALDLEGALERLRHEWVPTRGGLVHLEWHEVAEAAPTFVIVHGLGDHCRRLTPLAAALAERGFNAVGVDRQGHGLSEGRRGDAPLEADLALLEQVIALVRARLAGPVVLLGDSLGGIMSWYLLTREPDIDAAVCHCIAHPEVHHDPSFRRKAPLMRALARVAPYAPIPVEQIVDYEQVALDPETKRYFDERRDRLFNFEVSARSAASYLSFSPGLPWGRVTAPALVMIGAADRMVTPSFTERCLAAARPPRADLELVEGAGHQLFLDDLGAALEPLVGWVERALAGAPVAVSPGARPPAA